MNAATGSANAKLILIGEHAVVHGEPAIALPFPLLGVQVTVEPAPGPLAVDSLFYSGPMAGAPEVLRGLGNCAAETLHCLGRAAEGLMIRICSTVPPGSGLGSSAAVAVAMVRGLCHFHGCEAPADRVMALAQIAEVHAHGTPSGIDALAAAAERPLWFLKGKEAQDLPLGGSFHVVVADSGRCGDTRSAVTAVQQRLQTDSEPTRERLHRIGTMARAARIALAAGDNAWLGRTLNAAQADLAALGVSDAGLDQLVAAARRAGALGAKLTGGGRGGCVLALGRDADHARDLEAAFRGAGARSVWQFTLREGN